jgi:hypothetical protein
MSRLQVVYQNGCQEEDERHSVAPIPAEKIRELVAAEEDGEIEEADNLIGAVPTDTSTGTYNCMKTKI